MTEEDTRVALIREATAAFNRGDLAVVLAALDSDVLARVSPALMNSGTWHGADGFVEMLAEWNDAWSELELAVQDCEIVDERNVLFDVHQRAVGRGSGVPVELDISYLVEFRDGRIVRFEIHADRDSARAALNS